MNIRNMGSILCLPHIHTYRGSIGEHQKARVALMTPRNWFTPFVDIRATKSRLLRLTLGADKILFAFFRHKYN